MFSCWNLFGNEGQENEQIIFKGNNLDNNDFIENKVKLKDRQQFRSIIQNTVNLTMIKPSNYQFLLKECQQKKINFIDKTFPHDHSSLNFSFGNRKIIWLRITDIIANPVMVQEIIQSADVQQGNIGDCYFLASISSIAEKAQRICKIFDNKINQISKQGIYKLIICQQGQLKQLVIDDYFPVFADSKKPVFCKPNNKQIWVMLLEKAWAKLNGSYGNISAGYPHEVLNTFLVAPCFYEDIHIQLINNPSQKQKLWRKLMQADMHNLPMCAGSRSNHVCKGIKVSHTYSLLGCFEARNYKQNNQITKILKLRNPWGNTQYTGRHSECDNEFWSRINPVQKIVIFKKRNQDDGIFTMELDEFIRNFESLDISHDKNQFNYVLEKVKVKTNTQNYFQITVFEDGQCYITTQKSFNRNIQLKDLKLKNNQYGYIRLLLISKIEHQNYNTYQYVDSKLQANFPDVSLHKQLKAGKYILVTQGSFPLAQNNQENLTVSIYSKFRALIQKTQKPNPQFFNNIFLNYIQEHENKQYIGSNQSWTSSNLIAEYGLGYIAAHIDRNSSLNLKISCDVRKVKESGYKIIQQNKFHKNQNIQVNLNSQNNNYIIVFVVDFQKKKQQLKFPPKGVKVTRII